MSTDDADNMEFFKQSQLSRALFTSCFLLFNLLSLLVRPLLDDHLANVALLERNCANPFAIIISVFLILLLILCLFRLFKVALLFVIVMLGHIVERDHVPV